ncbi:nuclear transport factor 2 family protein [Spirosoma sp. BT702]|uniref:Nuclear transport factor 2 family protein n=1 Tax=Spirosoma profusum TaxID=2771354 RepID=A0A926Y2W7_9BACT|nr:nuclear transport factor 2 family protein [Spirosoma profusum]MBD2701300.1 nuclear transport factor 2 family protein [Spirosoma profusum]
METNTFDILALAKQHLDDISKGKAGQDLAGYYSEQIQQIEYPNRLNPNGGVSDFHTLIKRSEKGKQIITTQSYDIQKEYVYGNTVILEVIWKGVFSIPIGQLVPGDEMKANFALFMEFENGKIIRQRNYDCFEAF